MRIFIAGIDGYLGWPLAQYLTTCGHQVAGADAFFRRQWVKEIGSWSAMPICPMKERLQAFKEHFGKELHFWKGDLRDFSLIETIFREFKPEAIVHLGECPSAPYSMVDVHHAAFVQSNNITTTFNLLFAIRDIQPDAHLVKLGSMDEYGTPNVRIPEGFFTINYRGRRDRLPFPRQADSWYAWSKVHSSNNIMYACKVWGLRATDIMQGVVFGTRIDEMEDEPRLLTRLDFDQAFGTVVNRYCCQAAIGHPLTPFGGGYQKRGLLPLQDSMQCLTLALEHPAKAGEYRVLNQFANVYNVTELALEVQKVAEQMGLEVEVRNLENPRKEMETPYYKPDHQLLFDLGYQPTQDLEAELRIMLRDLMKYRERIKAHSELLLPDICWDGTRRRLAFLEQAVRNKRRSTVARL